MVEAVGPPFQEIIQRSKTNTSISQWIKLKKELLVSLIMRENLQVSQRIRLSSMYKNTRDHQDNRQYLRIIGVRRRAILRQF